MESDLVDENVRVVRFRESKPLPSYLVAMAVGPFEIIDGGKSVSADVAGNALNIAAANAMRDITGGWSPSCGSRRTGAIVLESWALWVLS